MKNPFISLILFLICVLAASYQSTLTYAVEPSNDLANRPNSDYKFVYDSASWDQSGNDNYTKLLLHPNALILHPYKPNSLTIFLDSSASNHHIKTFGDVQIDTAQSKIGSSSILFDGKGDYLSIPDSDDWNLAEGDFTIDFWVKFKTWENGKFHRIFSQVETASQTYMSLWMGQNVSGVAGISFDVWDATNPLIQTYAVITGEIEANTWYHIAVVRSGNNFYNFIKGVQKGNTVVNMSAVPDYSGNAYVGWDGSAYYFDGWIDELRISKGIARWTSKFTPAL